MDDFIAQRCDLGVGYQAAVTALHAGLCEFAIEVHGPSVEVPNAAQLGRHLSKRGFKARRTGSERFRLGLLLKKADTKHEAPIPDVPLHDAQGKPVFPDEILSPSVREWCAKVLVAYPSLEEHTIRILLLAAQQWDRAQTCAAVTLKEGPITQDRFGDPKIRPEVAIERAAGKAFRDLVRELGIDLVGPAESPRPNRVQPRSGR